MNPARERLSDAYLRRLLGESFNLDEVTCARECLRLRRALRKVRAILDDFYIDDAGGCVRAWQSINRGRATCARALASPLAATKGGR